MPRPLGAPGLDTKQARNVLQVIRALYDECNHNATELGRRLGISQTAVSELVHGRNKPSFSTAERVARLTGTPVWSLLTGEVLPTTHTHPVLMSTLALLGDRVPPEARERVLTAAALLPDVSQATWIALLLDPAHTPPPSSRDAPVRTTQIPVVPKKR